MPSNVVRTEATRGALIAVATTLFCERGFAATSIEDILQGAAVSRGALYHHFKSKEELFRAVYEALEHECTQRIVTKALRGGGDELTMLEQGLSAFLDESMQPEMQRIVLVDGPSVLGWDAVHEIGERYGFGLIKESLEVAMTAGLLERQPADPLAHLIMGAMIEAAQVIARSSKPAATRREMAATLNRLIEGLRITKASR